MKDVLNILNEIAASTPKENRDKCDPALLDSPSGENKIISYRTATKDIPTPEFKRLPREDQIERIMELKLRGQNVSQISRLTGLTRVTVYEYLRIYLERSATNLNNQPPFNLVTESLEFYSLIEDYLLQEFSEQKDREKFITNETSDGKLDIRSATALENLPLIKQLVGIRELKLNLMLNTGVIPKEPEKLFVNLKQPTKDGPKKDNKTREEILEDILKLVNTGRSLPNLTGAGGSKTVRSTVLEDLDEDKEAA